MFIGHIAVGFAAKRMVPAVSLGTLFLAVQFADLLWPTLVLLGIEHFSIQPGITVVTPLDFDNYPYSHSLIMTILWMIVFGATYRVIKRCNIYTATILGLCVFSHWLLDFISHRPDMPLTITGDKVVGLGLWNSLSATLIVEVSMYATGVLFYLKATKPLDRTGIYAFWSLVIFVGLIYLGNIFGPPPPSIMAVAWSAQAIWLLVIWGYWIDRHRIPSVENTG